MSLIKKSTEPQTAYYGITNMTFRLIAHDWGMELDQALIVDHSKIQIVCPFIQKKSAARLLKHGLPSSLKVITRYNLANFYDSVSDIEALRLLVANGAQIRGVKNLHAKMYIIGNRNAFITSTNLTEAGISRNYEVGVLTGDMHHIKLCTDYFNSIWNRTSDNLTIDRINIWEETLNKARNKGTFSTNKLGLNDEGEEIEISNTSISENSIVQDSQQAFIKFFGQSSDRKERATSILDEIASSYSHSICAYPQNKRPRQVKDGDTMYIATLVKDNNDILIIGKATAIKYEQGRDDAAEGDTEMPIWIKYWPHFIIVHHATFIRGTINNGIS
ncbi:MAG: phospholipase D family protein, partial [Acidobacteriota bacterium]